MLAVEKFRNYFNNKYLKYFLVFIFFIFLFSILYFSVPSIISLDDPLFHIKYAKLIREKGLEVINNFQWIYYSVQARSGGRYYVSLFNFILIPFTYFSELWQGIKYWGVFSASLIMLCLYWWFNKLKFKYPFLILLFFWSLAPELFTWRIFLARPLVVMIFLVMLEIYFIWQKKYLAVIILSILHIFVHSYTFYLPGFLIGVFVVFDLLHQKKFDFKLIISGGAGFILGMMTMPAWPQNIIIWFKQLLAIYQSVWQKNEVFIPEGGELYGRNLFDFFYTNYLFIAILMFFILLRVIFYIIKAREKSTNLDRIKFFDVDNQLLVLIDSLFFLNIIFLIGYFFSGRVLDFWIPLAIIFIALMFKITFKQLRFAFKEPQVFRKTLIVFIVIILLYLTASRSLSLNRTMANAAPVNIFQGAGEWLANDTKDGEIIFIDNWSNFTGLFYFNDRDYYIMGMEPRFLYDYDRRLYLSWYNLTYLGVPCDQIDCQEWIDKIKDKDYKEIGKIIGQDIALMISNEFKSRQIVTSVYNSNLTLIMKNSEYFNEVYNDPKYQAISIFEINLDKLNKSS